MNQKVFPLFSLFIIRRLNQRFITIITIKWKKYHFFTIKDITCFDWYFYAVIKLSQNLQNVKPNIFDHFPSPYFNWWFLIFHDKTIILYIIEDIALRNLKLRTPIKLNPQINPTPLNWTKSSEILILTPNPNPNPNLNIFISLSISLSQVMVPNKWNR